MFPAWRNRFIPGAPAKNLLLSLLGETFHFRLQAKRSIQDAWMLLVTDSARLQQFISLQNRHSSSSDRPYPQFIVAHYSLSGITTMLETTAKIIIVPGQYPSGNYDLSLDLSDMPTLNKTLRFHGLELRPVRKEVDMFELEFY
jgi:hypothetical protein